ncbi:hypothetical protein [uncultured Deefgea sp.]|nr:hypothetical protein [uncultured Deefgea sp.]
MAEVLGVSIALPESVHLQMKLTTTVALQAGCAWENPPVRYGQLSLP